jgi:hypothetical protein
MAGGSFSTFLLCPYINNEEQMAVMIEAYN